jgi:PEP-CTERM motif
MSLKPMAGGRTKMRRVFTLACAFSSVLSIAAVAQPPVVFPTPSGPGVQLPFTNNDGIVDYGFVKTSFGWAFDSFQGNDGGDALTRFVPTLQGPGALTAMGETSDWVYHMEFSHTGEYAVNDNFMNAKAEPGFAGTDPGNPREQRIFAVDYNTAGQWTVKAGDLTGGGWVNVAMGLAMDSYVDFDVHYRADDAVMDFYWDGTLVGTAGTGHGRYDVDLVQFEEVRGSGNTSVRNIRFGHIEVVPEPATSALAAIAVLGILASSRRRRA